jgi:hypothetical protein
MAVLSLQEAAERTETSKVDIWRAIQASRLLAERTDDGGFAIDPAELFRVFEPQRPDERPMGQDATASPEASERPETGATPETSATPETAATTDMAVALAALGAELKGLQNPEERQVADLAERNAQLAELVAERAKAEKAIAKHAALEERALNPGGVGSSDGSTPVAAGQPGSACGKGCRGGHDRRCMAQRRSREPRDETPGGPVRPGQ